MGERATGHRNVHLKQVGRRDLQMDPAPVRESVLDGFAEHRH